MDPGAYRAALAVELGHSFEEVIAFPPDLVPSGEVAVIYPDDPYIEPGTYCEWTAYLSVVVFYSRTNEEEALDRAEETVELVAAATNAAGGSYKGMSYRPINIGGTDYLAAVHEIVFNEEG